MAGVAVLGQTRSAVVDAARDARAAWSARASAIAGLVLLAVLLPVAPLGLGFDRLASDLYLAAAAVGLGMVVGIGGMPSLGQGAFIALGAFATAVLETKAGWPTEGALLAGVVLAAIAGGAIGTVAGRLRPALVAVFTWLLAWLVAIGLAAFPTVSGGAQGIAVERGSIAGIELSGTVHYELGIGLTALAVLLFWVLRRSPVGVALSGARQHRAAAEALGVPVARLRAATFALGAAIAAAAGGLGVHLALVGDAAAYGPLLSAKLFIAVVLGGAVAPAGGLVGVAVLALLGRLVELGGLEGQQAARLETLLVALIVVAAVGAVERGLLPSFSDWRRHRGSPRALPAMSSRSRPRQISSPVAVEARGLTKRFGAVVALEDVNLDVPPATVHALIGPNGSGKTTALRVLAGWLEPDAGTVAVVGGRRDDVVGTLQATSVFPELTVLENAVVGAHRGARHRGVGRTLLATPQAREEARGAEGRAQRALETVGLGDLAGVLAHELPGNAQRRLMIATALAAEPRVLLLDEPSAGADRDEVDVLADLVGDLRASGFTVVLVEHNLRLVRRVADRVTVLAAGRSIAEGSVAEVAEDEAVLQAYLGGHRF
jgi:branched-chain amino acid transport system ATP-binding protein/branched-chain amino acid transport system permease protein